MYIYKLTGQTDIQGRCQFLLGHQAPLISKCLNERAPIIEDSTEQGTPTAT